MASGSKSDKYFGMSRKRPVTLPHARSSAIDEQSVAAACGQHEKLEPLKIVARQLSFFGEEPDLVFHPLLQITIPHRFERWRRRFIHRMHQPEAAAQLMAALDGKIREKIRRPWYVPHREKRSADLRTYPVSHPLVAFTAVLKRPEKGCAEQSQFGCRGQWMQPFVVLLVIVFLVPKCQHR